MLDLEPLDIYENDQEYWIWKAKIEVCSGISWPNNPECFSVSPPSRETGLVGSCWRPKHHKGMHVCLVDVTLNQVARCWI